MHGNFTNDDARVLRDRALAAEAALDALQGGGDACAAAADLVQTTTVSSYPAVAGAYYACIPCDVNGAEAEGGAATYVPRPGAGPIYAFNLGTQIPPVGTTLVAHGVGGRWAVRYDG
jgi:hypothetical protein